ncbi:MAG: hypothetical protein RR978_08465 [Oscillospiraceae bacterium]
MNFSAEFWIQLVLYAITVGSIYGGIKMQIKSLEEKVDKLSALMERMYKVEESCKGAHIRIDDITAADRLNICRQN